MGLKERVLSTVINNLITAFSFGLGAFLMLKAMPWLVNNGILPTTLVMK